MNNSTGEIPELSKEDYDALVSAWMEWKDICFVAGCSEDAQVRLHAEIGKAWNWFNLGYQLFRESDKRSIAAFFDEGMEFCSKDGKNKRRKDHIWERIAAADGKNTLNAIRGYITGRKGVIRDILRERISKDSSGKWKVNEDGKRSFVQHTSLFEDNGNGPLIDHLPSNNDCWLSPFNGEEILSMANDIYRKLNCKEKVALLAAAYGCMNDPSAQDAAGIGKSVLYAAKVDAVKKVRKLLEMSEQSGKFIMTELKNLIIAELRPEKSAEEFLLKIETKDLKVSK